MTPVGNSVIGAGRFFQRSPGLLRTGGQPPKHLAVLKYFLSTKFLNRRVRLEAEEDSKGSGRKYTPIGETAPTSNRRGQIQRSVKIYAKIIQKLSLQIL